MKSKQRSVLFSGTEHRERRRETIRHPPPGVTFTTIRDIDAMRHDHALSYNPKEKGAWNNLKHLKRIWKTNNWIAKRYTHNIDLVYSPGYLLFGRKPFVIEIDNVAVLAYYKLPLLRLLKPLIAYRLRSDECKSIVCISQAAQQSVKQYFKDDRITRKCTVVYPYAGPPLKKSKQTKHVTFLFVATNFYLKGGKEVVHAFWHNAQTEPTARLVIVTQRKLIEPALRRRIEEDPHITLVEANLTKEELFSRYYTKAQVFIVPTYQDSFGMVFLEALRAGLPIITTHMFATPEMVEHGKNGYLIASPIPYFTSKNLPNPQWWETDKAAYARTHNFPEVEKALSDYMLRFIRDPALVQRMSKASHKLLTVRFNETERQQALGKLLRL